MTKIPHIIFSAAISLISLYSSPYARDRELKFEQFIVEDGLSFNSVPHIAQDSLGFLWIGTTRGLNRYDGYRFKVYRKNPYDVHSLSDNKIQFLFVDREGTLWVGTLNGLNKYNYELDQFTRYLHNPDDSSSLSFDDNAGMYQDTSGFYWIAMDDGSLNRVDKDFKSFKHYRYNPADPNGLPDDFINTIYLDRFDVLWIGTEKSGLIRFDIKNEQFSHFRHNPDDPKSIADNDVYPIAEDREGTLWVGAGGLNRFDRETETFTHFKHDPANPYSLNNDLIHTIYQDSRGDFWIGTRRGLNKFDRAENKFYEVYNDGWVAGFFEDKAGVLWFGTIGKGLYKINKENQQFPAPLFSGLTTSVFVDSNDIIWIGSKKGLHKFDRGTAEHQTFIPNPSAAFGTFDNEIHAIFKDSQGIMWIGAYSGIFRFDEATKSFIKFIKKPAHPDLPFEGKKELGTIPKVNIITEDNAGRIWIGTNEGLFRYDRFTESLKLYLCDEDDPNTVCNHVIYSIDIDRDGDILVSGDDIYKYDPMNDNFTRFVSTPNTPAGLTFAVPRSVHQSQAEPPNVYWIGSEEGLYKYNQQTQEVRHFTTEDGLPHNWIRGITEDDMGNLWLSTNVGLSKFNPQTVTFKNYDVDDGLFGNSCYECIQNEKGEMVCYGRTGVSIFHPDSLRDDPHVPNIVLTRFKKFNKEVKLDSAISRTKQITLAHDENVFSFEFAALNFANPNKNMFAYKMEEFDKDWVFAGNKHDVTYTHLSPGEYLFRVKGSNHDGVWNEQGTSVRIIIRSPWWKTTWAYLFYSSFLLALLYYIRRYQLNRLKTKHELDMRQLRVEKLQEVDRLKSRFFANISHEFRTPLTLILGLIDKILSKLKDSEIKQDLGVMQRNAHRLQRLINQLLDLSKLEAGRMQLRARKEDIVGLVNRFVQSFCSYAQLKGIGLQFSSKENEIHAYVDRDKMEHIISNLISNALKFTTGGGEVIVAVEKQPMHLSSCSAQKEQQWAAITVTDTGTGISADRVDRIFDRFYQADESMTREPAPLEKDTSAAQHLADSVYPTGHQGTGIGLAMVKELVELHGGEISVHSEIGKGSAFRILLPLGKEHLQEHEIVAEAPLVEANDSVFLPPHGEVFKDEIKTSKKATVKTGSRLPMTLIVEDNGDLRAFIREIMQPDYQVIEAGDGSEGLDKSVAIIPDLIISDVMMPSMDGFELCRRLKTDERTSHIPVILLTARASDASKLEGLETGADDYVLKPFNTAELRARVKNLIEQRRRLRERFSREITLQPKDIAITSADERFMQRAMSIIEEHMSDPDLNVEYVGKRIGMSRVQLHRKLRALTDQSTTEFIRALRLRRAAELLVHKHGNVAEVAYEVGFNNPSYFAECFRKLFGQMPSKYIGN